MFWTTDPDSVSYQLSYVYSCHVGTECLVSKNNVFVIPSVFTEKDPVSTVVVSNF